MSVKIDVVSISDLLGNNQMGLLLGLAQCW
jgi:hypothetical protein